ncbi:hypothetical protein D3C71_2251550 [compost metagenome]
MTKDSKIIDISFGVDSEREFNEVTAECSDVNFYDGRGKKYERRKEIYQRVSEWL